jgi:hypothetical protein
MEDAAEGAKVRAHNDLSDDNLWRSLQDTYPDEPGK